MGYFRAGHYSTFRTYILGIPMITSKRTPKYLRLVWFCSLGIQFPTDPMMDQFLSSVWNIWTDVKLLSIFILTLNLAGGHRGPKGSVANEDTPWVPV